MTAAWTRPRDRPLVIAHRGASAELPENTMPAFRRAREAGADGVELDARICATGEVLVFHDPTLDRLLGQPGRIDRVSLASLRRMRVAGSEPVPLLAELFEELGPTSMLVNVEIKTEAPTRLTTPAAVARVLAALPAAVIDRVVVSSFDPVALAWLRRRLPAVACGLLFHGQLVRPLREAWSARWLQPFALHPERRLVRPPAVARWRQAGYRIHTWTVDKPRDWARFRDTVDAVITDRPGQARDFYRSVPS